MLQQPVFRGGLASPRVADTDTDTEWGLGEGRFSLTTSFFKKISHKSKSRFNVDAF